MAAEGGRGYTGATHTDADRAEVTKVVAKVKVVPARRTAVLSVALTDRPADDLDAKVNAKSIVLTGGIGLYVGQAPELPKTQAAVDAALNLLMAVRAELLEQGITE